MMAKEKKKDDVSLEDVKIEVMIEDESPKETKPAVRVGRKPPAKAHVKRLEEKYDIDLETARRMVKDHDADFPERVSKEDYEKARDMLAEL